MLNLVAKTFREEENWVPEIVECSNSSEVCKSYIKSYQQKLDEIQTRKNKVKSSNNLVTILYFHF